MDWSKADRRPAASLYFWGGGVHDSHVFPRSGKGCFNAVVKQLCRGQLQFVVNVALRNDTTSMYTTIHSPNPLHCTYTVYY